MMPATKVAKGSTDDQRKFNIGRPPLSPSGSVTLNIRLTPEQREKLNRLGGVQWLRDRINRAKDVPPQQ